MPEPHARAFADTNVLVCHVGARPGDQRDLHREPLPRRGMSGPYDRYYTHHRSRRLAGHDYAAAGWYFVTICTKDRLCLFGEVRGGVMGLNAAGCIAHACWAAIPDHVPRVRLGAFVAMPNHVHGLVGLLPQTDPVASGPAPTLPRPAASPPDPAASPPGSDAPPSGSGAALPRPGSLSSIVGSYKSAVTRAVRRAGLPFAWQPRFHDHVVRNEHSLRRIRAYIEANPLRWTSDTFHPEERRRGLA